MTLTEVLERFNPPTAGKCGCMNDALIRLTGTMWMIRYKGEARVAKDLIEVPAKFEELLNAEKSARNMALPGRNGIQG